MTPRSAKRKLSASEELRQLIKPRKIKNSLTVDDKLKVLEALKEGKSERAVESEFNISKNQVHNIKINEKTMMLLFINDFENCVIRATVVSLCLCYD